MDYKYLSAGAFAVHFPQEHEFFKMAEGNKNLKYIAIIP